MSVTVSEDVFEENYVLKFCGGTYSEVRQEKPWTVVVSDRTNLYVVPS